MLKVAASQKLHTHVKDFKVTEEHVECFCSTNKVMFNLWSSKAFRERTPIDSPIKEYKGREFFSPDFQILPLKSSNKKSIHKLYIGDSSVYMCCIAFILT